MASYYERNRQKVLQYAKTQYEKNKEEIRKRNALPEVKLHNNCLRKLRRATPEGKAKSRAESLKRDVVKTRQNYKKNLKIRQKRLKEYVDQVKATGCTKCGMKDIECLQFHHEDSSATGSFRE